MMLMTLLKSKIHRATVTGADLNYEGSISICPHLIQASGMRLFEQVDIYNCNNGQRFHTYVIEGKPGEVCLNGAAARLVHAGDVVIIACYAQFSEDLAAQHKPTVVLVNEQNQVKEIISKT